MGGERGKTKIDPTVPIIILCLGIPARISSWTMALKLLHMESIDSKCSGQSWEILWRSNHTWDWAPFIGVYGLKQHIKTVNVTVRETANWSITISIFLNVLSRRMDTLLMLWGKSVEYFQMPGFVQTHHKPI